MSEFKFSCTHCGQHLAGDRAWAGRPLNCPSCQQTFVVPAPDDGASAGEATSPRVREAQAGPPVGGGRGAEGPTLAAAMASKPASGPSGPPTGETPRGEVRLALEPPVIARSSAPKEPAGGTCSLAVASLVLSLLTVPLGPLGCVPGVVCGHLAKRRLRAEPRLKGRGLAIAGLAVGYFYVGLMLVAAAYIFAVAAFTGFERARSVAGLPTAPRYTTSSRAPVRSPSGFVMRTNRPMPAPVPAPPPSFGRPPAPPLPTNALGGTIRGQPFHHTRATLESMSRRLVFQEGDELIPAQEVEIAFLSQSLDGFLGRTVDINPRGFGLYPHLLFRWQENGRPRFQSVMEGYQLRLTLGQVTNSLISGSLSLKVGGLTPVTLEGNFTALVE